MKAGNLLKLVTLHSEDAAGYPTWYRISAEFQGEVSPLQ